MSTADHLERVEVNSSEELRDWLELHHERESGVWLVTFKKCVPARYVSRDEVLDELIAFGWIDGSRRKLDDVRTMQLISPRRAQHWARTYKERAARLDDEGRMHAAGLRAIERSKEAGLWNFMDDVDALIKPDDLVDALDAYADALTHFDRFPASHQRNILRWIKLAKTPATRRRRIDKVAALAADNLRLPNH